MPGLAAMMRWKGNRRKTIRGLRVTAAAPEQAVAVGAHRVLGSFVSHFREQTGITDMDERLIAALTEQQVFTRRALTEPRFAASVVNGSYAALVNDEQGRPISGLVSGMLRASEAMAAEDGLASAVGGAAVGRSGLFGLEDLDRVMRYTGTEKDTFQSRIDKWQHALRLCSRTRLNVLLGKDLMGSAEEMQKTFKRLRRDQQEQMPVEIEWTEVGRMGAMEDLKFYTQPVTFERFMQFDMEADTPGLFSLADFASRDADFKFWNVTGSGAFKTKLVRVLDDFALACVIYFGLPDLKDVESFRLLRRLIGSDIVAFISDAYIFYTVNSGVCRLMRKFKHGVEGEEGGELGLRGHAAFLTVGEQVFARAAQLMPHAGSCCAPVRDFVSKRHQEISWGEVDDKEGGDGIKDGMGGHLTNRRAKRAQRGKDRKHKRRRPAGQEK